MYLRCPKCGEVSPPDAQELKESPSAYLKCRTCWVPAELYRGEQLLASAARVQDVLQHQQGRGGAAKVRRQAS